MYDCREEINFAALTVREGMAVFGGVLPPIFVQKREQ